jgi:hypothetical protein
LRLGAAGPGMDLEIAVIAVGLARQQAFELALRSCDAQLFECRLGLGDDGGLAFGFAERDQLDRLVELALDPVVAADRLVEPGPLAQQFLRRRRIVP